MVCEHDRQRWTTTVPPIAAAVWEGKQKTSTNATILNYLNHNRLWLTDWLTNWIQCSIWALIRIVVLLVFVRVTMSPLIPPFYGHICTLRNTTLSACNRHLSEAHSHKPNTQRQSESEKKTHRRVIFYFHFFSCAPLWLTLGQNHSISAPNLLGLRVCLSITFDTFCLCVCLFPLPRHSSASPNHSFLVFCLFNLRPIGKKPRENFWLNHLNAFNKLNHIV